MIKILQIKTSVTRQDCERDLVPVKCPHASTEGFSIARAEKGNWLIYEKDNNHWVCRVICRVTCDLQVWLEVAQLSMDGNVYIRWVDPDWVHECYLEPPRRVFNWITSEDWDVQQVHTDLSEGV